MSQTALDLLVRVAGERLVSEPCAECGGSLESAAVSLRSRSADCVVLEVVCRECAHAVRVEIRPEAGEGSAHVG